MVPETFSFKNNRVEHWGSAPDVMLQTTPVLLCFVRKVHFIFQLMSFSEIIACVCFSSSWALWLVCSVFYESLAASLLSVMGEHRRVKRNLAPWKYLFVLGFKKKEKRKHIIHDICMEMESKVLWAGCHLYWLVLLNVFFFQVNCQAS